MTEDRLTIKIDRATKEELRLFATSVGLTSSRMVRALIKQALRERRVLLLNKDPALAMKGHITKLGELTEDLE